MTPSDTAQCGSFCPFTATRAILLLHMCSNCSSYELCPDVKSFPGAGGKGGEDSSVNSSPACLGRAGCIFQQFQGAPLMPAVQPDAVSMVIPPSVSLKPMGVSHKNGPNVSLRTVERMDWRMEGESSSLLVWHHSQCPQKTEPTSALMGSCALTCWRPGGGRKAAAPQEAPPPCAQATSLSTWLGPGARRVL